MGNLCVGFEFLEIMLEKSNFSLVIVNQESDDVMDVYHALHLTFFV